MPLQSRSDAASSGEAPEPGPLRWVVGGLLVAAWTLALLWNYGRQESVPRGGWDETTHLELPAARIGVAIGEGEWGMAAETLLACEQYPFVAPVTLAVAQGLTGIGEGSARAAIFALWVATLVGLLVLGAGLRSDLSRAAPGPDLARARAPGARWLPLLVPLSLAAASPLGARYAWTLFLEVPVACALTWTLVAWLARLRHPISDGAFPRDLLVGLGLTCTFFTKFNYGVLLAAGIVASCVLEALLARGSARTGPSFPARLGALLALPALACAWWFLFPFPGGGEHAAAHRTAFWEYLVAERGVDATPWTRRAIDWATGVAPGPIALVLLIVAVLASLAELRRPGVRALWCALLAGGPAVWFHPFHLDRFLLPGAPVLFAAGGVGAFVLYRALAPGRGPARAALGIACVLVAALAMVRFRSVDLARALGVLSSEPELRAYQESVLADLGWGGKVPSAGLRPEEHAQLMDWIDGALGEGERFAWIGLSSELSPAAIHLELLARRGNRRAFLAESARRIDVTPVPGMPDPSWSLETLRAFLEPFDVVFVTSPPDLKDRAGARAVETRYHRPLLDELGFSAERLGECSIAAPPRDPIPVQLYALRPSP